MALILLGILLLAVFIWLAETARLGVGAARVAATIEAIALGGVATLGIWVAMYVDHLWEGPDGTAQLLAALFGWGAIWIALGKVIARAYRDASTWMVVAAGCFAVWTAYMAQIGDRFGI